MNLHGLSAPSNTVCTNAWASTGENRGSFELTSKPSTPERDEFIHVKQVISQQSEMV